MEGRNTRYINHGHYQGSSDECEQIDSGRFQNEHCHDMDRGEGPAEYFDYQTTYRSGRCHCEMTVDRELAERQPDERKENFIGEMRMSRGFQNDIEVCRQNSSGKVPCRDPSLQASLRESPCRRRNIFSDWDGSRDKCKICQKALTLSDMEHDNNICNTVPLEPYTLDNSIEENSERYFDEPPRGRSFLTLPGTQRNLQIYTTRTKNHDSGVQQHILSQNPFFKNACVQAPEIDKQICDHRGTHYNSSEIHETQKYCRKPLTFFDEFECSGGNGLMIAENCERPEMMQRCSDSELPPTKFNRMNRNANYYFPNRSSRLPELQPNASDKSALKSAYVQLSVNSNGKSNCNKYEMNETFKHFQEPLIHSDFDYENCHRRPVGHYDKLNSMQQYKRNPLSNRSAEHSGPYRILQRNHNSHSNTPPLENDRHIGDLAYFDRGTYYNASSRNKYVITDSYQNQPSMRSYAEEFSSMIPYSNNKTAHYNNRCFCNRCTEARTTGKHFPNHLPRPPVFMNKNRRVYNDNCSIEHSEMGNYYTSPEIETYVAPYSRNRSEMMLPRHNFDSPPPTSRTFSCNDSFLNSRRSDPRKIKNEFRSSNPYGNDNVQDSIARNDDESGYKTDNAGFGYQKPIQTPNAFDNEQSPNEKNVLSQLSVALDFCEDNLDTATNKTLDSNSLKSNETRNFPQKYTESSAIETYTLSQMTIPPYPHKGKFNARNDTKENTSCNTSKATPRNFPPKSSPAEKSNLSLPSVLHVEEIKQDTVINSPSGVNCNQMKERNVGINNCKKSPTKIIPTACDGETMPFNNLIASKQKEKTKSSCDTQEWQEEENNISRLSTPVVDKHKQGSEFLSNCKNLIGTSESVPSSDHQSLLPTEVTGLLTSELSIPVSIMRERESNLSPSKPCSGTPKKEKDLDIISESNNQQAIHDDSNSLLKIKKINPKLYKNPHVKEQVYRTADYVLKEMEYVMRAKGKWHEKD